MDFKRILNLFLLVTLSLFVLSACSDDSESVDTGSRSSGNLTDDDNTTDSDNNSSNDDTGDTSGDDNLSDTGGSSDDVAGGDNTEGDDTTDNTEDDTTGDSGDDNTDSSEGSKNSESYYQFNIASAFYNAASKLNNAALVYDETLNNYVSTVDTESIIGAKDNFKEAYELVKEYIEVYELSQKNNEWNSNNNFYCSSLANCLSEIDKGFANLDNITLDDTATYYSRPTINAYMENLTNEVVIPMYLYLYSYVVDNANELDDYLLVAQYSKDVAYELYLLYTSSYGLYKVTELSKVFYRAQIAFYNLDSSIFDAEDDTTLPNEPVKEITVSDETVNDIYYAANYTAYIAFKYCNYQYDLACSDIDTDNISESAKNDVESVLASGESFDTYIALFNNAQQLFVEAQNDLVDQTEEEEIYEKMTYSEVTTSVYEAAKAVYDASDEVYLTIAGIGVTDGTPIGVAFYASLVGSYAYYAANSTIDSDAYNYVSNAVGNAGRITDVLSSKAEQDN